MLALLNIALLFSSFQCGEDDYIHPSFDFQIDLQLEPQQKIFHVGDTIRLSFRVQDYLLTDTLTKAKIFAENGIVPFQLYAGVRHANINLNNSPDVFAWEIAGIPNDLLRVESNGQRLTISFELGCDYKMDNYLVEIKLIPRKSGIYKLDPMKRGQVEFGQNYDCNEFNDFYILGNLTYRFDVPDPNADILAESPLPQNVIISGDDTQLRTSKKEIYWMKVL